MMISLVRSRVTWQGLGPALRYTRGYAAPGSGASSKPGKKPAPKRGPNRVPMPRIILPRFSTVAGLATILRVKFVALQSKMDDLGFSDNSADYIVDAESAKILAEEFNRDAVVSTAGGEDLYPLPAPDADALASGLIPTRPPVIAIMGHVDHGKTTLLDYFRSSRVVDQEKGGITQHIGAFASQLKASKQKVCFLDTPGHEAFLKLRERGAHTTDLVLLAVAANDSVMPQTKEAIKHARAAGVPMVVAITKMDMPDAKPEKVIADLATAGVDVEDYGGDTQCVPVSVVGKIGLDDLEGAMQALIEILDVRSPKEGPAEGVVVESQSAPGLGAVVTAIVRRGLLKPRDIVVAGSAYCRVRNLLDENNKQLKFAEPGTPVRITGWQSLPEPGETMLTAQSEDQAKRVVATRERAEEEASEAKRVEVINENRINSTREAEVRDETEKRRLLGLEVESLESASTGGKEDAKSTSSTKIVKILIRADVQGSAEALADTVGQIGNDEVRTEVLASGVGPVTESDIFRAQTGDAQILVFSQPISKQIQRLAEKSKVKIKRYDVIYKALEDLTAELSSMLTPQYQIKVLGTAELREVFKITAKKKATKTVAGVRVNSGAFTMKSLIRVMRDGQEVYRGKLSSIQHGKDILEQANKGSEYGFGFQDWDEGLKDDEIEAIEEIPIPRYL